MFLKTCLNFIFETNTAYKNDMTCPTSYSPNNSALFAWASEKNGHFLGFCRDSSQLFEHRQVTEGVVDVSHGFVGAAGVCLRPHVFVFPSSLAEMGK